MVPGRQTPIRKKQPTPKELISHSLVKAWETDLEQVWGVAVNKDGNVWACGKGGLRLYDPDGGELKKIPMDGTIRTITVDGAGGYYIGTRNRIVHYNST